VTIKPSEDADKSVWVAYAIRNGLPESDALAASKDDLVAIFGDASPADPAPAPAKRTVTRK
jgi:hypothetical protein